MVLFNQTTDGAVCCKKEKKKQRWWPMVKMLNDMLLAFPDFRNFQMHSRLGLAHAENHVRVTAANKLIKSNNAGRANSV